LVNVVGSNQLSMLPRADIEEWNKILTEPRGPPSQSAAVQHISPWLAAGEPPPDLTLGTRRARAAAMLMLALPGGAYIYQGEELGLPEVIDLPAEARQDPTFHSTGGEILGRDGCRVPLPWVKDAPGYGFGTGANTWLPQPDSFGPIAVDQQTGRPESMLEMYRSPLAIRRSRGIAAGDVDLVDLDDDLVIFDITTDAGTTRVIVNLGERECPIPSDAEMLIASEPGTTDTLPTHHAVWLVVR
jgi:alpha-glucosidase